MPRALDIILNEIFSPKNKNLSSDDDIIEYKIKISFFEIYNEKVYWKLINYMRWKYKNNIIYILLKYIKDLWFIKWGVFCIWIRN